LRHTREHEQNAIASVNATTAKKVGGLAAEAGYLTEGQFAFGTGCGMDMPKRNTLGTSGGPPIHDVRGEIES
jgi:hypothetical protein